jgi:hypothetical protein
MTKEIIMAKAKTKMTEDEKLEHVLQLQDLAIKLIHKNGQWQRIGATPVMGVKNHGNLSIIYMTPFQRPSQKKPAEPLGYAIEVCVGRRVVLSLVWNRTGPIFLETYRPGAWETKLEEPNLTASLAA